MLSWKNIREGSELIRVSRCGRFEIRRLVFKSRNNLNNYRYKLADLHGDQDDELGTLQEARQLAEKWARNKGVS